MDKIGTQVSSDLEDLLRDRPWSAYQIGVLLLASIAILFDGFDNQSLGFALPAMMRDWGLPKQAFAAALAVSQLGMLIGAIVGGWLGDRYGRKPLLVLSLALFGLATAAISAIETPGSLVMLRIVSGLGLGAAFPNAAAFAAEFAPHRSRSLAVSISIVCVPLGGVLGGFAAAAILPAYGWRTLFLAAGVATLAATLLLAVALPESVRFLAQMPGGEPRARHILARMGIDLGSDTRLLTQSAIATHHLGEVWAAYRNDTAALWIAFFFCLMAIYAAFGWLPALLADQHLGLSVASQGLAYFNLGGVVAALVTGWMMGRFGSRLPLVVLAAGAIAAAIVAIAFPGVFGSGKLWLFALLALEGGCVNGVQTTLYALAAHIYPTRLRAFGVGAATGMGRFGAMSSSYLGAMLIGAAGATGFHGLIAAAMAIVAIALLMIRRHQTATPRGQAT